MHKRIRFKVLLLQKVSNFAEKCVSLCLYRPKGRNLSLTKNIPYDFADKKGSDCEYIQQKTYGKKRPVLIYIHGGGWVSGLKKVRRFYCYEYAEKGYFVVNCDYAYAPQQSHPKQLQQIFKVIEMIVLRRDELNVDTDQIVIGGDSAGAYLAAMVSAIACGNRYEDIGVTCSVRGKFKIAVNVLMCGAYNVSRVIELPLPGMKTFLMSYTNKTIEQLRNGGRTSLDLTEVITRDFPPTFIIKAEHDPLKVESDRLERMLSELGIEYGSYLATGALSGHCFPLLCRSKQGKQCLNSVQGFIEDYIRLE